MTESAQQGERAASAQARALEPADAGQRAAAVEAAFAYRGDVTIHTADGRRVDGYLFDRRADGPAPYLRVIPADGSPRLTIPYAAVRRIDFSGHDPAAGHHWENWVRQYAAKKARGEPASPPPEPSR